MTNANLTAVNHANRNTGAFGAWATAHLPAPAVVHAPAPAPERRPMMVPALALIVAVAAALAPLFVGII